MAEECLRSGMEIERVFVAQSYARPLPFEDALLTTVSDDVFRFLSDEKTPQGVLCRVKLPRRQLLSPRGKCLLLDGVSDPGNMGAIIRCANAAGYEEIYLTEDCTDPYSPKSVRASMSGVFFTKLHFGSREEILETLKEIPLFVADMGGENLFSFHPPKVFALAIGNEANGVSEEVRKAANTTVAIPMKSTQESLNAAVSAGIAMYLLAKEEFLE
ncbi:MAG: RNA methyltransferase [Clostridia bacterium]|nr:RNA methyltransferase [Clostridia bacterium]